MGREMAANLIRAGHRVRAFDVRSEAIDALAALGAALNGDAILAKSSLDKADVEAIKLAVSELAGCDYCAAAHTLVAVAPAHYDLYRRDATAGLGAPLARHLTIDQAAVRLMDARHSQDTTDA